MKYFQLIILFLFLCPNLHAQQFLGKSKHVIIAKYKTEQNYGPPEIVIDGKLKYLKYESLDGLYKIAYYLDKNNICYKWILLNKNYFEFRNTVKSLNDKHQKLSKDIWISKESQDYIIRLDRQNHFFAITYSNQDVERIIGYNEQKTVFFVNLF